MYSYSIRTTFGYRKAITLIETIKNKIMKANAEMTIIKIDAINSNYDVVATQSEEETNEEFTSYYEDKFADLGEGHELVTIDEGGRYHFASTGDLVEALYGEDGGK